MNVRFAFSVVTAFTCFIAASPSQAASKECPGKVTEVMVHANPSICDGRLAFRLDSTGTTYICTLSNLGDSMVLAAFHSGKTIRPRLDLPLEGNCLSIQENSNSNYVEPSYIKELH